jgi:hypothetical protein
MTKETAEQNIAGYFWAFNRRCQVNCVTFFGPTLHYGFVTVDDSTPIVVGWIPVDFVGGTELTK